MAPARANSARFLDAFAAIEKHLRRQLALDRSVSFYQLVERASSKQPLVANNANDLREYADLRNAIVHERAGDTVIAEPHERVVEALERIAETLQNPPKVWPTFQKHVQVVEASTALTAALKFFLPKNFSQVPVVDRGRVVGLLTTNTVSRWLAAAAADDLVELSAYTVAQVLRFTEYETNWRMASRRTPLQEVIEMFRGDEERGRRLDAVLLTDSGKASEALLGIVTIHDMPKLLRKLDGRSTRGAA